MSPAHPRRRGFTALLAGASAVLLMACAASPSAHDAAGANEAAPTRAAVPLTAGHAGPAAPRLLVSAPIAAALSTFT